jgi:hypothetical protein
MSRRFRYMGATTSPGIENYPLQAWDWLLGARNPALATPRHLEATMAWLARAQDAGSDDGLARMYHVRDGWGPSYPETTGYAIPTFLAFAEYSGRAEFADRALRMARWESKVQLKSGAVQGGVISAAAPSPAIFNTGQVLFGWRAAFCHAGTESFRQSALKAADYLVAEMDSDGAWRRNLSAFTSAALDTYAYNVRSAWALLLAQELDATRPYKAAALRNVEFVLSLCQPNGWIAKNCLSRPEQPLLHTIAYAYQGLLECAVIAGLDRPLEMALRGNRELRSNFEQFGQLHGRYDNEWNPTVRWRCLTGEAQSAIVWQRLAQVTGDHGWAAAASALIAQLKRTQRLTGPPGRAGGVQGSHPITAPYGRLEYPNWAAKFFADALLGELEVPGAGQSG